MKSKGTFKRFYAATNQYDLVNAVDNKSLVAALQQLDFDVVSEFLKSRKCGSFHPHFLTYLPARYDIAEAIGPGEFTYNDPAFNHLSSANETWLYFAVNLSAFANWDVILKHYDEIDWHRDSNNFIHRIATFVAHDWDTVNCYISRVTIYKKYSEQGVMNVLQSCDPYFRQNKSEKYPLAVLPLKVTLRVNGSFDDYGPCPRWTLNNSHRFPKQLKDQMRTVLLVQKRYKLQLVRDVIYGILFDYMIINFYDWWRIEIDNEENERLGIQSIKVSQIREVEYACMLQ